MASSREGPRVRGLVWGFSCQAVVLGFAHSSLFGAGKAVLRPVACDQVPGARGRGQGTETLESLAACRLSVACVSQCLVWGFSCQAVVLGFAHSSLFGAGKAV